MTYDQAQSPRLGQRTAVESTYVQMFDVDPGTPTPDLVEAAWGGMLIFRSDTNNLQIYDGLQSAWREVGSGNFTFVSSVMPPGTTYRTGDVWYDSGNSYQLYIWDESVGTDGAWASTTELEMATTVVTSEALAAGDLVNIYNANGLARTRKASATAALEAHGYVTDACAAGMPALVIHAGTDTLQSGLVPGKCWLSSVAGKASNTAPTSVGALVQRVGYATNDHTLEFSSMITIKII